MGSCDHSLSIGSFQKRGNNLMHSILQKRENRLGILKVLVWIVCDGTMVDGAKYGKKDSKRIQFKLSRPEKIERLTKLLEECEIPYTKKPATMSATNKLLPYMIRIYGEEAKILWAILHGKKRFPLWFMRLDSETCKEVLYCLEKTDGGRVNKRILWTTTSLHDVLIIFSMCTLNNVEVSVKAYDNASGFKRDCKRQYKVNIRYDSRGEKL